MNQLLTFDAVDEAMLALNRALSPGRVSEAYRHFLADTYRRFERSPAALRGPLPEHAEAQAWARFWLAVAQRNFDEAERYGEVGHRLGREVFGTPCEVCEVLGGIYVPAELCALDVDSDLGAIAVCRSCATLAELRRRAA